MFWHQSYCFVWKTSLKHFSFVAFSFLVQLSFTFGIKWVAFFFQSTLLSCPTFWPLTSKCITVLHKGGVSFPFGHFWDSHIGQRLLGGDKQKPHSQREANLSSALFMEPGLAVRYRLQGTLWYHLPHYLPPKIQTHSAALLSLLHCTIFFCSKGLSCNI